VITVDAGPLPFLPLNGTGRRVSESDQAQRFSLGDSAPSFGGVTGQSVRIGIADSGVDQNHDDFDTVTPAGNAGTSRVYNQRTGSGSHGTHVASIAGGNGFNADANGHPAFSLRGHAPEAQIGDYSQMGSTVANYHAAIVDDDTDVTNHSYVQSMDGYGIAAETLDQVVRGDATHSGDAIPAQPQVWAAGNNGLSAQYGNEEGYYALFTSAKNTISVGSVDTRDGRVSDFSSLGPTFDGRIKPDVMAPGCNDSIGTGRRILAARNNTQGYTTKCGTSMAAPVVSGIVALMMESYSDSTGGAPNLLPSTYKAILVQTARDMVKTEDFASREFDNPDTGDPIRYHSGPDFSTGFGLVDADAAVRSIADTRLWMEQSVETTGELDTFCVDAPAGVGEIKTTLTWDDEPGSTLTSITTAKLVNDLDLELVAPLGGVVRPWTLDPLPVSANPGDGAQDPIGTADIVPARRGVDRRNNVEMANAFSPAIGEWKVRVRAFNLPNANPQPYSLAISLPVKPACNVRSNITFHKPIARPNWATVPVLLSNGDGTWTSHNKSAPRYVHESGVIAITGDFNGDGRGDVAFHKPLARSNWATVPVLLSHSDGTWTSHNTSAPKYVHEEGVTAITGDFNGDGRGDVAFHKPIPRSNWQTVPILLSNGDGTWTSHNKNAPKYVHESGVIAITGDFNGNGHGDVAFHKPTPRSNWRTVPVLLSKGDGTWTSHNTSAPKYVHESGVIAITGDFNRNGRGDVAFHKPIPRSNWATVPMLLSDGDGTWTSHNRSAPKYVHEEGAIAITGDFNGDGRGDVAFHKPIPRSNWRTVPVLLSNGNGTWTTYKRSAPKYVHEEGVIAINFDG
jgi:hypothetical protein